MKPFTLPKPPKFFAALSLVRRHAGGKLPSLLALSPAFSFAARADAP
jgi:hypothetical protein